MSLAIKELVIKTTSRFHVIPVRRAKMKKQILVMMWGNRNPH